jgi:hypothetical protein
VSPILTRPIREQLEHDRVIRLLQARYKRKNEVIINPGNEQNQSVTVGDLVVYPDLLLFSEGAHKLLGTIEVETGESVNALEARAEWNVFGKLDVPLHLYVPPTSVDAARRLCAEYDIRVAELWTYHANFDQVRFTLVHRSPDAPVIKENAASKTAKAAKPKPAGRAIETRAAVKTAPGKGPSNGKSTPPASRSATSAKAKPAAAARPAAKSAKPAARPSVKAKVTVTKGAAKKRR